MNKPQVSIDCFRKLHRTLEIASLIEIDLLKRSFGEMQPLYIPRIFSYIYDDIADVLEELKEMGLCDDWLRQDSNSSKKR
ncbi:Derepression protein [Salmonella enterica]|nr:Derepression protein [Salmonella enterica]EBG8960484.1 Derepression protein [Salmonella enterica]EID9265503.1 Derepression protein [Salmonella enterica]